MIRVNDKLEVEWQEGMTVVVLLERCHFTSPKIAVFVDQEFVHRDLYETYPIADGAEVRVLHLIGGHRAASDQRQVAAGRRERCPQFMSNRGQKFRSKSLVLY